MKQKAKSAIHIESNEKNNKGNINKEKNNKRKSNNSKNEITNLINLAGITAKDYSSKFNTNTYKNIKLKEKLMKLVYNQGKKSKIKDRNGKLLILDSNSSNKENISFMSNRNHKRNNKDILKENNKTEFNEIPIKNFIEENESKKIKKNNKPRTIKINNDCISEKLRTLDNRGKNKLDIELSQNDESYFNVNGERYKGTISFNNFIISKKNELNNDKEKNEYSFMNKLKERNKSYKNKKILHLDSDENILLNNKSKLKNKNSLISYNFRNSRSKIFNENTFSTSLDKDTSSMNRNSLQMLEILKNSKSTRVILKPNDTIMNNKKEKKDKDESEQKIKKNEEDKSKKKRKSIFNEIMDEVSKEKNYVQKIVHMKLIQGMKLLRQNSHRQFNVRYNSKTYEHNTLNKEKNIFTIQNKNNENNNEISNNALRSSFISNNPEKNISYIKISNSCKSLDENRCVKIKKIKLDKLKNKLKRDSFKYCPTDNNKSINISLSLNNKIININNNHRIYAPKKPTLSKKRSIELSSIPLPFYYPNPEKNQLENKTSIISPINPASPIIYKKSLEPNKSFSKRISIFNSIRRFNETSINDINKIETNNKLEINNKIESNNNYNIENNKPNIKYILYNKVRIKKDSSKIRNTLNNSRYKTIRYIKKNNSKIKRIEDSLEKENENSKNKIMKIKEIQFGILKKNNFKKSLNNLDRTEPINFNLNEPINKFNKQNSLIKFRTFLSHDINDITDIPNYDFSKKNILSTTSQIYSNNEDEMTVNTGTCHIGYNFSYDYDKISTNYNNNHNDISNENETIKLNFLKEELKGKEQIYNLLNFEDLLIIEDKLNLILIVLEQGNKTFKEYFDLIIYFFSSNLRNKLEQIFKYFKNETNNMQIFINYSLIFILICYDFAQNSICVNIDNDFNLIEIFQIIYRNILIVINSIKNQIEFENNDNYKIRLIELSKIGHLKKINYLI